MIRRIGAWFVPDPQRGSAGADLYLTAFGKHPGWDDHIRDIDIPTKCLVALSQALYERGIQANIDSGKWESLEPSQRLDDATHVFVWSCGGDTLVGRMWPSEDGKGRKKYPMAVCLQMSGGGRLKDAIAAAAWLKPVADQCRAATTADAVRQVISEARADLPRWGQQLAAAVGKAECTGRTVVALAKAASGEPIGTAFYRVMYQMHGGLAAYRADGMSWNSAASRLGRAEHLRLPVDSESGVETGLRWLQFVLSQVSATTPCLALIPAGQNWVDVIVGDPTTPSLFCLRVSSAGIPLVSASKGIDASSV